MVGETNVMVADIKETQKVFEAVKFNQPLLIEQGPLRNCYFASQFDAPE